MTARGTNVRFASAAAAGVAVMATSLAAVVLPQLANADDPASSATASPSATPSISTAPSATTQPTQDPGEQGPGDGTDPGASESPSATNSPGATSSPGATGTPSVDTTNAPGSTASFAPAQEWTVPDPRFNKSSLSLLTGETFTMFADVAHTQPLSQDLLIKVDNLTNLECEVAEDTVAAGTAAGLQTFDVDCTITAGQSLVNGTYTIVEADGTRVGEGLFGSAPAQQPSGSPSIPGGSEPVGSAKPDSDGPSQPSDKDLADVDEPTAPADAAAKAEIAIDRARFTPDRFAVRTGQEFRMEKDVTITEAPLHSELTMSIDRYRNLTCDPVTDQIAKGSEGTSTLVFDCTITGVDRAPGGWYDITLADGTVLVSDAYFGLGEGGTFSEGDDHDNANPAAQPDRRTDTSGGLANTGGPLIGLAIAGLAVTAIGATLIRRRL